MYLQGSESEKVMWRHRAGEDERILETEVRTMRFGDGGRGREYRQPLDAGKGKKTDFPLEPREGTQSWEHFHFSPVKLTLGFWPLEL